jgi:hypothetical protein
MLKIQALQIVRTIGGVSESENLEPTRSRNHYFLNYCNTGSTPCVCLFISPFISWIRASQRYQQKI